MIAAHELAVLLLAVVATLASRGQRRAVLAASAVALGGTALRVATEPGAAIATLPPLAVTIDAGLEILGALLAVSATVAAIRARETSIALLAGCAAGVAGWSGASHAANSGLLGALGFALGGVRIVELAARIARPRSSGGEPRDTDVRVGIRWPAVGAIAATIVIFADNAIAVVGAAAAVSFLGRAPLAPDAARPRFPWLPLLAIPPLALACYLIVTIAGPTGFALAALRDGPFSPAAEALLVPLLAVGALPFMGMRPLSGIAPRSLLAPVGVAMLARVAASTFAGGMAAWETVAIPFGVLSICIAAVTRDMVAAGAAMAWIASFSTGGAGAAWWLAGAASGASAVGMATIAAPMNSALLRLAAVLGGAWGAVGALQSVLRTETLYGLIAWLALTAAVVRALVPARD